MKQSKKINGQRGFTLVEVIVVAIIIAALAAVAIPLYNGYVTSSKTNAAANAAGSVASLMGTCVNQGGTAVADPVVAAGSDIVGPATISCTLPNVDPDPSIKIPAGIIIKISSYTASGTVKGKGGTTAEFIDQTYSY